MLGCSTVVHAHLSPPNHAPYLRIRCGAICNIWRLIDARFLASLQTGATGAGALLGAELLLVGGLGAFVAVWAGLCHREPPRCCCPLAPLQVSFLSASAIAQTRTVTLLNRQTWWRATVSLTAVVLCATRCRKLVGTSRSTFFLLAAALSPVIKAVIPL